MPDRYWVGGTANWDGTAGTKWATTSGGAGGASVPTAADDVYFDAASGAVTCTVSANVSALSVTFTGFTGTLTGTSSFAITSRGSVLLSAGMTYTFAGTLSFTVNNATLTSSGKTVGPVSVDVGSNTVNLGDALTSSGAITVTSGTFTTNNQPVNATSLSSNNSNTRTINLGSSTVALNGSGTQLNFATSTGLTFNAGTSTINSSGTSAPTFSTGGVTFHNVAFTNAGAGTATIAGSSTFNNLTVTAPAAAGVTQVTFDSRQTINGTLSTTGTAGNRRVWFRGATYGIAQTLTINSAPSLTDADFRDIYVIGTAAPISGTRIGNLRGCRGITFSTPKTVYWNTVSASTYGWTTNAWALTSGGAVSTDNFPLAQDTAVFDNASTIGTLIFSDIAICAINATARTASWNLSSTNNQATLYGDLTLGSGVTMAGAQAIIFSGRNTQTITSAGKTFSQPLTIDSYGGTVQLADALNNGSNNTINVTNGTFDTKNYNITTGGFNSSNSNVRTILLGSSTISIASTVFNLSGINLTFSAGTSQITMNNTTSFTFNGGNQTFHNVSFTSAAANAVTLDGVNTFNNISCPASSSAGVKSLIFSGNQTINGTLTVAGASAVRRVFLSSNTLGTPRTLTVNSLSAQDCDFRDITIAGAAAGSSPTRAGDCGGNTGITFPAPKTVYWNLGGTVDWSADGWATSSGGTPATNNFPLAQDTAVFDEAGTASIVRFNAAWNVGVLNASTRTSAVQLSTSLAGPFVYGNWSFGTGVTSTSAGIAITFSGRGTQTITSNGVTFGCPITIDCFTGTVQLADALTLNSARTLTLTSGTFDAVTYNVTAGTFTGQQFTTLRMGSGTWTLSGNGSVWNLSSSGISNFFKGTANIILSNTGTGGRTFTGGGMSYNKLTIGGATGTSTTTIDGNNQFTELASTKTVAHTIALGTTTQTFGAWTVTGTLGNVVTFTGTGTSHVLAGACTSGIDYLAMGSIGFAATSPGEFYAGANSTATSPAAPLYLTAKPADSTRFWVGGTGNWSDTARWSTSSGGAGGASVPRSHDDVVFDSLSNATAYTATVNAVTGGIRCKALTVAGPLAGNLTLAGSTAIVGIHGNVTLPATGLTRTYTGAITLSGSATGRTFTSNGVTLASAITVNGVGCEWTLGSALNIGVSNLTVTNGSFLTGNYNTTCQQFNSNNANTRAVTFGSSTIDVGDTLSFTDPTNLTFSAGTSQVNLNGSNATLNSGGQTFYNVSYTTVNANTSVILTGSATFNNLTKAGLSASGITGFEIRANQTINGTFTISAGGNATQRNFVRSDTIGTTRTLTCAAFSGTDVDFRDITIAGAAAPVSGTRLGDCKGNSGITFDAPKTVYWRSTGSGSWGDAAPPSWSLTLGGTATATAFPLAQDTAVVSSTYPNSGSTVTINAAYNIGTIDMSARTSNTMTLASSVQPLIYGNWINGTGTTLTGSGIVTLAGRGSQTVTSAGIAFTQSFNVNTPGGSVTLQDAYTLITISSALTITAGTFNANGYSVTLSGSSSAVSSNNSNTRTIAVGSGTWTIAGSGIAWTTSTSTNLTVTGTGTISLTSASAKTFNGGGVSYSGITLNQGGAGTLTITGNNTFANISNSYKATGATNITLGTTTQRVGNFTASGEAGRVLTVQGTSASSPATLVFTGAGTATQTTTDYLAITGVRAYSLATTWYAGANSTNNGSLGWIFEATPGGAITVFIVESATANSTEAGIPTFNSATSESATGLDAAAASLVLLGTLSESATAADAIEAARAFFAEVAEATAAADVVDAALTLAAIISESAQGQEAVVAQTILNSLVSDSATVSDSVAGGLAFIGSVAEAAAAAESLLASLSAVSGVSESATVQDIAAVLASTFSAASSEAAAAQDSAQAAATFPTILSEFAQASETASGVFTASTSVSESAAASDAGSSLAVFGGQIAELAAGLDAALVVASVFSATASEIAQAQDLLNAPGSIYNATLPTEGARASDSLIGAYLWNLIDDSQIPDWTGVLNPQNPGWANIGDEQVPNWQNVDNTQAGTWTAVSDDQTPGWVIIPTSRD